MPRVNLIQVRRDTAANWTSANPTLAAGETGFETDTRLTKVGNGSTAWTSLPYTASSIADGAVTTAKIGDAQVTTAKFAATASIGFVNSKSFMVQTTQPTTRPGGTALVAGDVWISYTA
jgi:hypothetical protein